MDISQFLKRQKDKEHDVSPSRCLQVNTNKENNAAQYNNSSSNVSRLIKRKNFETK